MIVGFILALRHKDNKPLVIYRNIKSQDNLTMFKFFSVNAWAKMSVLVFGIVATDE